MSRLLKQLTGMLRLGSVPLFPLLLLPSTGSGQIEPFSTDAGGLQCVWTEGARTVLTFPDGTEAYVEPATLVRVNGGAALFGVPNYQFPPGAYRFVRDSLFGALIDWDLSARPVLPPAVAGDLYGHSTVQMDDGGLLVGFAVLVPGTEWPGGTVAARFGVGRYRAGEWGPLTWVTPRDGIRVNAFWPSKLMAFGDSVLWAFKANTMRTDGALVMVGGRLDSLTLQEVSVPFIEQVSLAYLPGIGPAVAFTRSIEEGDTILSTLTVAPLEGGVLQSSGPRVLEPGQIHRAEFLESIDPGWISAPMERSPRSPGPDVAIAMEILDSGAIGEPIVIGEHVSEVVPVGNMDGDRPLWALAVGEEILLTTMVAGAPRTEFRFPNPYIRLFRATLLSPNSVLLAGIVLGGTPEDKPTMKSLLIRLDAKCGEA